MPFPNMKFLGTRDENNKFELSSIFLLVLCFILGGIAGVVAIFICRYILSFGGSDSTEKHGISTNTATRIGGVLIVVFLVLHISFQIIVMEYQVFAGETYWLIAAGLVFFLVGLYEDLRGALSARFRFGLMLLLAGIWVSLFPDFVLRETAIDWVDSLFFSNSVSIFFMSCICLVFLTNAFNTADGANGLVSGISLIVVLALTEIGVSSIQPLLYAVAVSCVLFLIFNLGTGRFFLGDGGAYFLGSVIALFIIRASNETDVSTWYLIALITYPILDLVWSVSRRLAKGSSPFTPDNEHLHNLIFAYVVRSNLLPVQANTITGLGIAALFSGIPYVLFFTKTIGATSDLWLVICGFLLIIYLTVWHWLYRKICIVDGNNSF